MGTCAWDVPTEPVSPGDLSTLEEALGEESKGDRSGRSLTKVKMCPRMHVGKRPVQPKATK